MVNCVLEKIMERRDVIRVRVNFLLADARDAAERGDAATMFSSIRKVQELASCFRIKESLQRDIKEIESFL